MKGTLFGDHVEGYKDAFIYNGNYEIGNAPIKSCESQWKTSLNDLDYQMSFGRQTIIQPIDTESGPILPKYQTIAHVPMVVNEKKSSDVLGVVIYIEEKPRKVVTGQGRELLVREIVIVDHSVQQPMLISAWNDLTENDCETLNTWSEKFPVGFTALRVSSYKGLSLTTRMSTTFFQSPKGIRASNLEEWTLRHQDVLADM
ncbi:hypothetical protein RND81_03G065700 [Saponaria officinalis]|uniref:Replication protein A OB domain-containing protein n=1 Tax=Saponaria officinalis TaxID=3572 RepID=A0AAW1LZ09_SAPOF